MILDHSHSDIWLCSIDLRRACDTIEFSGLFEALRQHGVPEPYVNFFY